LDITGLRVVLVAPRNPLNIGAAARAMANFGFSRLRLVNPYEVAFREARSAVRAGHILSSAEEFQSVAAAVSDCSLVVGATALIRREAQHPVRRLEYGGRLLCRALASAPAALLFGSEKYGLSNDDLGYCHWLMRIPTVETSGSMNLGQAVAVCLFELVRDSRAAARQPKATRRASAGELERLTELLLQTLDRSGYVQERTTASTVQKLRRLVRRMDLSAHDAEIWLGMARQILWRMENPEVSSSDD
jgi:tRNA/rRNA methyltransferase